ncbi:hypothetical protein, unknown function [Leishmania mexicana MHOM/GT/2001/U1103]|uniref:Uncharacterized protein n=1 Tax=Leishmania mexicana (strain MHOM/GT/2001/U1103) TaxID=929439 RepID=E9AM98_LEIMU|nr:hypothetical protein, unknown function [Leishmania mexicana MHOM/GT/2001/U1103]CBZ24053.1 hypothetical protein, unknown function [Leishmania mexicana MHOM/GT/2001/U1103]
MRGLILFEAAALLLCWVVLLILTEGPATTMLLHDLVAWAQRVLGKSMVHSATLMPDRTLDNALPEELLSLFWMRRAMAQPYRSWYLHNSEAYSGVPATMRLPKDVVAEGQILYPFHVLYLYACGVWLQWMQPELAMRLLTPREQPRLTHSDAAELRSTLAWVSVGCVVLVGAPGAWFFAGTLSHLLRRAVCDRECASRLHLPADVCTTAAASAVLAAPPANAATASSRSPDETIIGREKELAGVATRETGDVAAFLGSLIIVLMGILPLLVVEVCTMQPWCLCGSLLVWALFFALQNELQLHVGEAQTTDASFDMSTPIVVGNGVEFCALKQEPSVCPLIALSVTVTVMSLAMPSCLFATLLFFLWSLSACWQRGYRRVLVKLKLPSGTRNPSVGKDGYVRMGYSCYRDTLWMNRCFCCATLFAVCLVLAVTTPWWLHQQPVLTFMDLFASPLKPSSSVATKGEAAERAIGPANLSFTGGHEMHACCLVGPYSYYNCARPTPNMWRLTEWLGFPWTSMAKALTGIFTVNQSYINEESPLWLNYIMLVLLTLANAGSIVVLTFYRVRKPPLSFETPVVYAAQRAAQRAEHQSYWAAKRAGRRDGARPPAPPALQPKLESASAAQGSDGGARQRAKVVTCLSREEYVVKQVVLLCWMLSASTISGTVLFLRNAPSSCVLVFTSGSLLAAVSVVIGVLRCERPLAFHPVPQRTAIAVSDAWKMKGDGATAAADGSKPQDADSVAAPEGGQGHDASAAMPQDGDDARPPAASRWCTTAVAPSLAHAADVPCLYLVFTASVLSIGALTWATVPMLLRHGILLLLCCCTSVSLVPLRTWTPVDITCNIFARLGAVSCVGLGLLLAAQAVPQWSVSAVACRLVRFTDKMGDVYTHTGDNVLRALIYQCIASCFLYACCAVHATLRVVRLALEPEEVHLVPIEEELRLFQTSGNAAASVTGHAKRQQ